MGRNINEDFVVEYIRTLLPEREESLDLLEVYAEENNVPIIEPEVAQLLRLIINLKKPKRILEVGTAIGYSSIVMAKSLDSTIITTIEKREDMVKLARDNIIENGLSSRIKVLEGDAEDILVELEGKFDLIFLDAAKGQYINFFDKSIKLLSEDGLIISDNVLFNGMVASDELVIRRKKTIVKRLRSYLEYINNIEGFISSIIPIGDGLALTYRKG